MSAPALPPPGPFHFRVLSVPSGALIAPSAASSHRLAKAALKNLAEPSSLVHLVPGAGVEPTCLAAGDFEFPGFCYRRLSGLRPSLGIRTYLSRHIARGCVLLCQMPGMCQADHADLRPAHPLL